MGCFLMPKGVPNKRYTGEFKQMVVETLRRENLSYREAEKNLMFITLGSLRGNESTLQKGQKACMLSAVVAAVLDVPGNCQRM